MNYKKVDKRHVCAKVSDRAESVPLACVAQRRAALRPRTIPVSLCVMRQRLVRRRATRCSLLQLAAHRRDAPRPDAPTFCRTGDDALHRRRARS
eukprot:336036-Prymnesium_polylepis.1